MKDIAAHALPLMVMAPLLAGLLAMMLGRVRPWLAAAAAIAGAGSVVALAARGGQGAYAVAGWHRLGLGAGLYCDALSRVFVIVIAAIAAVTVIHSLGTVGERSGGWYGLVMMAVAGMNGVVLAGDLFSLWVSLELAGVASAALVALGGRGGRRGDLEAAFKAMSVGAVASGMIVLALAVAYCLRGTLNMGLLAGQLTGPAQAMFAALLAAGLALKTGLVPFHGWRIDAARSSGPAGAMTAISAGACGIYAICRIFFNVIGVDTMAPLLMGIGAISAAAGVLVTFGRTDVRRAAAFHSVSHCGVIVLALGMGGHLAGMGATGAASMALVGAILHVLNSSAFGMLSALSAGAIGSSAGAADASELGGLSVTMPKASISSAMAALSSAGVPPLGGFWSQLCMIGAAVAGRMWLAGALLVAVAAARFASLAKQRAFFGRLSSKPTAAQDIRGPALAAQLALMIAVIGLGVFSFILAIELANPAADVLCNGTSYAEAVAEAVSRMSASSRGGR